jgi:hypothetical protein
MGQLNPFRRFVLALLSMIALGTAVSIGAGNAADVHSDSTAHEAQPMSSVQSR